MKTLTRTLGIVTLSTLAFSTIGFSSAAVAENSYIPPYLEAGLVSICKSAAKDKLLRMTKTMKEFHLKSKIVALNVVCNGKDIISFAEGYGAVRTTAKLSKSIGHVQVTDIASLNQLNYDVTFEMR